MMHVAVLGANGMLGKAVAEEGRRLGHKVAELTRRSGFDLSSPYNLPSLEWADVVINCAGITHSHIDYADPRKVMIVNGIAPHLLRPKSREFVQISTDCIFDGNGYRPVGGYTVDSPPNPIDLYGFSKLAGEMIDRPGHLTIRTSFISFESGLLHWFLSLPTGSNAKGWRKAIWNGFTVDYLARYIYLLLSDSPSIGGIIHVGGVPISKYDILRNAAEIWDRMDITIDPVDYPVINRSLNAERFYSMPWIGGQGLLPLLRNQLKELKARYDMTVGAAGVADVTTG